MEFVPSFSKHVCPVLDQIVSFLIQCFSILLVHCYSKSKQRFNIRGILPEEFPDPATKASERSKYFKYLSETLCCLCCDPEGSTTIVALSSEAAK